MRRARSSSAPSSRICLIPDRLTPSCWDSRCTSRSNRTSRSEYRRPPREDLPGDTSPSRSWARSVCGCSPESSAATEITYTGLSSDTSNGLPLISLLPCGRSYSAGGRPHRRGRRLPVPAARGRQMRRVSCLPGSPQQVLARILASGRVTEGLEGLLGCAVQVLRHLDVHGDQ